MKSVLVPALGLVLLLPGLSGCGDSAGASGSAGIVTVASTPKPPLELLPVDEELSRKAQATGAAIPRPPAGEVVLRQLKRDAAGNVQRDFHGAELSTAWVLKQDSIITPEDVSSVTNPGTDSQGRPYVAIKLTDGAAQKLASAPGQNGAGGQPAGTQHRIAVIIDSEVKAVLPLSGAVDNGKIIFNCTAREALDIETMFSQPA